MNRIRCQVSLYDGRWKMLPTWEAVRNVMEHCVPRKRENALDYAEKMNSDSETLLQFAVVMTTRWKHSEAVRDRIVEVLLRRFQPEYESMIEVEVCM